MSSGAHRAWWGCSRQAVVKWLAPTVRHPVTSLLTGLGLVMGGAVELLEDLIAEFDTMIASYHGVILLDIVMALRGFADSARGSAQSGFSEVAPAPGISAGVATSQKPPDSRISGVLIMGWPAPLGAIG